MFAAKNIRKGIIVRLDGDQQLFELWKNFIVHNHWIDLTFTGWVVTDKGKQWIEKVGGDVRLLVSINGCPRVNRYLLYHYSLVNAGRRC